MELALASNSRWISQDAHGFFFFDTLIPEST